MRILTLVMHSGEAEFEQCIASLKTQTLATDLEIISGLGNAEAHAKLYSTIMAKKSLYDYFIKCDADMVMLSKDSIQEMIGEFKSHPDKNHLCFGLHDWFSDSRIIGMHVFRSDVTWSLNHDSLLLDPNPVNARTRYLKDEYPAPVAYHVLSPTEFQSFYFGLHRTLKVLRRDEEKLNIRTSLEHFMVLRDVYRNYLRSFDKRLGLVLLGMLEAQKGELRDIRHHKTSYADLFKSHAELSRQEIKNQLESKFPSTRWGWYLEFLKTVGLVRVLHSLSLVISRRLFPGKKH